jgi:HD-GYP domain-containing protein (c-di-GMP phosphodiesterase class II)
MAKKKNDKATQGPGDSYAKLIEIGIALSAERNHQRLLEIILLEAKALANADGGTFYLRFGEERRKTPRRAGRERRHKQEELEGKEAHRIGAPISPREEKTLVKRVSLSNDRSVDKDRRYDERRLGVDRREREDMKTGADRLEFAIIRNDTLKISMGGTSGEDIPFPPLHLYDLETDQPNHNNVATHVALSGKVINIADAYEAKEFDFSGTRNFDEMTGYRSKSFLTVPLKNSAGDVIGVLQLINAMDDDGKAIPFSKDIEPVIESLASQAAVAIDNQQLLEGQKNLLESFIELIASAIDAKSPYTGGHCQRVPKLTEMLARVASAVNKGPFKDFSLNEEEFYELHIAAWLHDCGKVTTPEYVVDKATKLETIYNRIHEIRTRFEVLKRDAEIVYLRGLLEGQHSAEELKSKFDSEIQALDDDFNFIAESNVGGEFLDEEKIGRIQKIGARRWVRTLDDRVGLSHDELTRIESHPAKPAPCEESLLDDKPEHVVLWGETDRLAGEAEGFKMKVPEVKFNNGEVYNLSISRGTLTEEERYKINEHIVQTIRMLNHLPFPKSMKRVPEYAGGHHETLIGTGYPKQLSKDEMSVPARVMAIADIFEALTACDRPYKKAKTLSEAIKIMSFMRNDEHIDPDLFDLFLTSGVYKAYAEVFLDPAQLDEVDIKPFLSK